MKVVFWSLVGTAILGVILALVGMGIYGFDFDAMAADLHGDHHHEARSISLDDLDMSATINISVRSQNLVVREGTEFRIDYYYNTRRSNIEYSIYNGVFSAEFERNWRFGIVNWPRSRHVTVTLTLPAGFDGILNLESRSGNKNIGAINAESINLVARSGNTTINRATANSISVESRSGNTTINRATADVINVTARSGNNRITVVGNRTDHHIVTSNRSGNTRIDGRRMGSSHTEGAGQVRQITMTVRSGNNTLNFV